jgi:hypothetical protein
MDDNQFYVEMVSNLAWPIVAVVSVLLLKDKLKSIFSGGIKSVKHGETEIGFFDGKQTISAANAKPQNLQHLIPRDPTGFRDEVEVRLKEQLDQVQTSEEKIDVLLKNLAHQQLSNLFQNTYFNIYGSQIELLEYLSAKNDIKSALDELVPYFNSFKNSAPEFAPEITIGEYLNFLVKSYLIECHSSNEWSITKQGVAFLTYLTVNQFNKSKPY